jgi:SAM-dependent methyltransferase
MSGKEWYEEWFNSPFYHKLYFERDEAEAKAFINKLIGYLKPLPESRMLDVACGKGRHSKTLAALGFYVMGIDLSPDSIAFAKQFETDHLQFYIQDMRLPFYANYFDYAFNFFTSFGYFKTRREHNDAFRTISRSLKRGGRFVMDYLNIHYAEDHLVRQEVKEIDGTTYHILRWHDETHFYKKILVEDSFLKAPLDFTEKVAKLKLGDFTEMMAYQGLQISEIFGDYNFSGYDVRNTPRLIFIADKR